MKRRIKKIVVYGLLPIFILLNGIAAIHAYRFTHFQNIQAEKSSSESQYEMVDKIGILLSGIDNPKPLTKYEKPVDYEELKIESIHDTYCWRKSVQDAKGTIIMFHGYGGEKSGMLRTAAVFDSLGYNTLLVDLMGAGQSLENETTIGFKESQQVIDCFNHEMKSGEKQIILFGTSMGAVSIMKALTESDIKPGGIILECPFGTMYETVKARFRIMNVPAFPMAGLLVFWGGLENGFWAFDHNPTDYANKITSPTLLLYRSQDPKVSLEETQQIFENMKGIKSLKIYPNAGHESYLGKYRNEWTQDVATFLDQIN